MSSIECLPGHCFLQHRRYRMAADSGASACGARPPPDPTHATKTVTVSADPRLACTAISGYAKRQKVSSTVLQMSRRAAAARGRSDAVIRGVPGVLSVRFAPEGA